MPRQASFSREGGSADSSFDRVYNEPTTPASSEKETAHSYSEEEDGHPNNNRLHPSTTSEPPKRHYSLNELVKTLGGDHRGGGTSQLPAELERRVLDFRLAQRKRREKYGEQQRWGIFGMYAHLSNVRIDLEWAEDAAWRRRNRAPYLSWSDFDEARRKSTLNRPYFTYCLIVVCSIMMVVAFALNGWKMEPLNVNPLFGPSADALRDAGARDTPLIVEARQWFRIFTPLFLHGGLVHYFINMAALWFIGAAVEQNHGSLNAVVLFVIPGVGGNILSAVFLPQYISVGASGGIFGCIGGCLSDITLNWKLLFIKSSEDDQQTARRNRQAILWLVLDIVVNCVIGLTPYVDNFCHVGGLVYGFCCGLSILEPLAVGFFGVGMTSLQKAKALFVRFFGLIVSVVAIMLTTGWLASYEVGDSPCSPCRYISCVPFPFFSEDKWWHCDDCDVVMADLYKAGDIYSRVDLTCPNGEVESIDILEALVSDRDEVRHKLPALCRGYCDSRFN